MYKKLIALSALGLAMSAQAQTNVIIYGTVDTGFVKETGSSTRMDESAANLIGVRGSEELANGIKATFQLERQFQLPDGTNKETYSLDDSISRALGNRGQTIDWTGAANVGLEGPWGWSVWGVSMKCRQNSLPNSIRFCRRQRFGTRQVQSFAQ